MILNIFLVISHPSGAPVGGEGVGGGVGRGGISVKIGGDQDFSDFILFYNIRCLDDINMNRERKAGGGLAATI